MSLTPRLLCLRVRPWRHLYQHVGGVNALRRGRVSSHASLPKPFLCVFARERPPPVRCRGSFCAAHCFCVETFGLGVPPLRMKRAEAGQAARL